MENNNIFSDITMKKVVINRNQISKESAISISPESNNCPDCRIQLVRLGTCFSCPLCGFGGCG